MASNLRKEFNENQFSQRIIYLDRNLFHHFQHQHSDTEAFTFWAGCGAIRKEVFEEMGGLITIGIKKLS